jgi:aminopeptidase S
MPRLFPRSPVPEVAAGAEAPGFDARSVRDAFAGRDMVRHLDALQDVADANDGNRAAGTSGYEASARYVEKQLRAAGYAPVRQEFSYWGGHDDDRIDTFSILADTAGDPDHTIIVGGTWTRCAGARGSMTTGAAWPPCSRPPSGWRSPE